MRTGCKAITENQEGYALMMTMLLLVLLTLIGIAATHTSNIEEQIASNEKGITVNFNKTESALVRALEDWPTWLTITFLNTDQDSAEYGPTDVDIDGDGTDDVIVEARFIKDTSGGLDDLSTFANDVPQEKHTGPPPPIIPPSSMTQFIIRKFAVSVTAVDGRSRLQAGGFRIFNKTQTSE
jgi:hypothetical protein